MRGALEGTVPSAALTVEAASTARRPYRGASAYEPTLSPPVTRLPMTRSTTTRLATSAFSRQLGAAGEAGAAAGDASSATGGGAATAAAEAVPVAVAACSTMHPDAPTPRDAALLTVRRRAPFVNHRALPRPDWHTRMRPVLNLQCVDATRRP